MMGDGRNLGGENSTISRVFHEGVRDTGFVVCVCVGGAVCP